MTPPPTDRSASTNREDATRAADIQRLFLEQRQADGSPRLPIAWRERGWRWPVGIPKRDGRTPATGAVKTPTGAPRRCWARPVHPTFCASPCIPLCHFRDTPILTPLLVHAILCSCPF